MSIILMIKCFGFLKIILLTNTKISTMKKKLHNITILKCCHFNALVKTSEMRV